MTVGSLFSGIGGLDLGFERAGFEIKWMCEKEEYPRKVLAKHWPNVPIYEDVNALTNPPAVDVLIGGFPCQDISQMGLRKGLSGERSGLWFEMLRIVREVRPAYMVAENVSALTHRGLDIVLGGLAALGYDAEWDAIPVYALGGPHARERCFLVAYTAGFGRVDPQLRRENCRPQDAWTDAEKWGQDRQVSELGAPTIHGLAYEWFDRYGQSTIQRVVNGVPGQLDRLRSCGNTVSPAVSEYVARCVRAHAEANGLWQERLVA